MLDVITDSPVTPSPHPLVGEIEIHRYLGSFPPPPPDPDQPEARYRLTKEEMVSGPEVLAQMDAHRARGVRCLLVSIETMGGVVNEALAVFDALRAFSREG